VDGLDESVPVEVDFFDYSTINNGALYASPAGSVDQRKQCSLNFQVSQLTLSPAAADCVVPLALEPPRSTQVPSYTLDISTSYDELFCDPGEATPELLGGSKSPLLSHALRN